MNDYIDDRVKQLRRRVRSMVEKKNWKPDLKTILKLESEYKVTGGFVDQVFEEEHKKYIEEYWEEQYDDCEDDDDEC